MATAENTSAVSFPNTVPQNVIDNNRSITHWTGWTTETGGTDLYTIDITDSVLSILNQTITIPAGMLVITVASDATSSDAGAERGVRGYIKDGIWWQAHYNTPGTNRTANVLSDLGRVLIAESGYTVAQ